MGKRTNYTAFRCIVEGCKEYGRYAYDNRKEGIELSKKYYGKWVCLRHTGNETLSVESPERKTTLTAILHEKLGKNFWDGKNGFAHGNGYRAYAEDFPPGTILEITARLIIPEK